MPWPDHRPRNYSSNLDSFLSTKFPQNQAQRKGKDQQRACLSRWVSPLALSQGYTHGPNVFVPQTTLDPLQQDFSVFVRLPDLLAFGHRLETGFLPARHADVARGGVIWKEEMKLGKELVAKSWREGVKRGLG
jgi:hypothetical protein